MTSARRRWLIFAVIALGYILVYFHRLCAAVVATDMQRDLGATGPLLGAMASAYFWPYAFMQLPAGLLSDSFGPRRTISIFFVLAFIGSVVLALAPTVGIAILGRTLVGLGVSMLFVPAIKILAVWFNQREFPVMTGVLVAIGGVGSLIASGPLARLNILWGWRNSFLFIGGATLVFCGAVLLWVRDRPEGPVAESSRPQTAAELAATVRLILHHRPFWPLAAWFFFECAIFFAFFGLWGGPFLHDVYHLGRAAAGDLLMMGAIGMIVGSPLLSFLSNRVFRGRKPVLIGAAALSTVLTIALALDPGGYGRPALMAILFGLGLSTNAIVSVGFTAAKELFVVRMAGAATGLINLFPFLGGGLLQIFIGWLLGTAGPDGFSARGWQMALVTLCGCAVIALVASLLVRETLGRKPAGEGDKV